MDTIITIVNRVTETRNEEDFIDRLNYKFSAYLFCLGSLLITSKLYLGNPITCWTPAEFKGGWIEYTRDFCLVENTYYVPLDDAKLPTTSERENAELPYYQWVQFVLVLLAFCFHLPHLFWRSINWQSGIQVRSIVSTASKLPIVEKERKETVEKVASHISTSLKNSKYGVANKSNPFMLLASCCFGQHFLTFSYLLTKFLFLVNIIFQIIILHLFLGFNPLNFLELKFGFNTNWKKTGLFPRSTMCDFEVRTKGNVQRYSVQCVLQLNMFNEKIFVVFYYWLLFLFAVTLISMSNWFMKLFIDRNREEFGRRMLRSAGILPHFKKSSTETEAESDSLLYDENQYRDFVRLSADEVLLLRLISSNAGDIAASDITAALYKKSLE